MKTQNYTTHIPASSPFSAQNLAKTYLSSLIPLSLNVTEENFEDVAEGVYDLCHMAGDELRGGRGRGSGSEDIRVALSVAMGIEIDDDYYAGSARQPKTGLTQRLRRAWQADDVDTLVSIFCGLERNAATAMVDHNGSELVKDLEVSYDLDLEEEETEEELRIDMVEVLIMSPNTVQRRKYGGNAHKPRSKPAPRCTKQLVMEME